MRKIQFSILLSLAFSATLSGCGGGGGGAGLSSTLNGGGALTTSSSFSTPVLAGTVDPLVNTTTQWAITDLFAKDINADGVDEVVMGGRISQSFTAATHSNFNLEIFGWNNNPTTLSRETATWFSGADNVITGTEPSIRFGNFTGRTDGKLDMFVAGGVDSGDVYAASVLFKNNGNNTFTRINAPVTGWSHGSAVGDINGDGVSDIVTAMYQGTGVTMLGGSSPQFISTTTMGDSVALGKFVAGTAADYAVFTQGGAGATLFNMSRFDTGTNAWVNVNLNITDSSGVVTPNLHTYRIEAVDINNDSLKDILVVARPWAGANGWDSSTNTSYLMFYKNLGNGNFERISVTTRDSALFYNIEIKDINGDGIKDIMLSSQLDKSMVLLAKVNGSDIVYTEASGTMLSDFAAAIPSTGSASNVNIVKGPNNKSYLVGAVKYYDGGDVKTNVFYSEITTAGIVTAESSVAALKQMWPQLTDAEATQILSLTGTKYGDGYIINMSAATKPLGYLHLLTGSGERELTGHISGVDFGSEHRVMAMDQFRRNYSVNMTPTQIDPVMNWTRWSFNPTTTNTALMSYANNQFAGVENQYVENFVVDPYSNDQRFSFAGNLYKISDTAVITAAIARTTHNPWFSMSGAWGNITGANMMEIAAAKRIDDWTLRAGVIDIKTMYRGGIVSDVSTMQAAWADVELAVSNKFTVAGGILPTLVNGSVTANFASGLNNDGSVNYTSVKSNIISNQINYLRFGYSDVLSKQYGIKYAVTGMATTASTYAAQAKLIVEFK